jgi:transposase
MRPETLVRGLVDGVVARGGVPRGLVFDTMRTVPSGRAAPGRPRWNPALLHLAAGFGVHPEAGPPGAGNQQGSGESLVAWVKGTVLAGREGADAPDLASHGGEGLTDANARPSPATGVPPVRRLGEEAAQGGPLPAAARGGDAASCTRRG